MALRVHFDVHGERQFDALLDRFDLDKRNTDPLWDSISRSFIHYMSRQFSSQGAEFGDPWVPIQSARYAALKAEAYPGQPTLQASGRLKASLTRTPLPIERRTRSTFELGSNVPYGPIHQRGVPQGTRMHFKVGNQDVFINGLPRRRVIGMNASMRLSWRKKIQRFLVRDEVSSGEER